MDRVTCRNSDISPVENSNNKMIKKDVRATDSEYDDSDNVFNSIVDLDSGSDEDVIILYKSKNIEAPKPTLNEKLAGIKRNVNPIEEDEESNKSTSVVEVVQSQSTGDHINPCIQRNKTSQNKNFSKRTYYVKLKGSPVNVPSNLKSYAQKKNLDASSIPSLLHKVKENLSFCNPDDHVIKTTLLNCKPGRRTRVSRLGYGQRLVYDKSKIIGVRCLPSPSTVKRRKKLLEALKGNWSKSSDTVDSQNSSLPLFNPDSREIETQRVLFPIEMFDLPNFIYICKKSESPEFCNHSSVVCLKLVCKQPTRAIAVIDKSEVVFTSCQLVRVPKGVRYNIQNPNNFQIIVMEVRQDINYVDS